MPRGIALASLIERLNLRPELLGGIGRALASPDYRCYAAGHIAHVHGWWCNRLGIGWLTWQLTGSSASLGTVVFAAMIPTMFIAPFAGALADRHGHRRIARIFGSLAGVVTLTIALLTLGGFMTLPLLIALVAVQGSLFGTEFPARQALIPQLVRRENISAAVAMNATSFQIGTFLGPVIAGVLITNFSAGAAVLFFACTTVWMQLMLTLVRPDPPRSERRSALGFLGEIQEGLRYIAGNESLRLLLTLLLAMGFLIEPYKDLLPGFADQVFGRGADALATMAAAGGIGSLFAALFLVFRGRSRGLVRITMAGAVLVPVFLVLFTASGQYWLAVGVLPVLALVLLLGHTGAYTLIQSLSDPEKRGRVISITVAVTIGGPATGALFVGWLADQIGLRLAVATAACAALVIVLAILPGFRRRTGEMEAEPAE